MPGTPPATARLAIPRYSDGDTASFSAQVNAISDTTDSKVGMYTAGTRAGRLAATNIDGLLWRETDTGQLFLGTGTTWLPIGFSYVGATVNTTAANGQWLVASAGVTVALPSAAVNARVKVSAASGVSGSSPVTVSGTNIQGVGLSSASSFKLGVPGAFAELISDGTNWFIVAGGQDTGWVALTLLTGVGSFGGYTPSARLVGNEIELSGILKNTSGGTIASITNLAQLPAAVGVPASEVGWLGQNFAAGGTFVRLFINPGNTPNNAIAVTDAWASNASAGLDGWRFRLT